MKFLIKIQGLSRYAQPRQGEFRYSNDYSAFIFTGEPVTVEQFNKHFPRLAEMYMQYVSQGRREYLVVEAIESKPAKIEKVVNEVVEPEVVEVVEPTPEATDKTADCTVTPKGRGRYDVVDSDGETIAKNVFLKKAQELCPSYTPPTK